MAFGTNLWNDVHQIYHIGCLLKKNKRQNWREGKVDIFSLSGQLIPLSSFWLESKLAIGPSPQSSRAYADGLPEANCCPYSGRTPLSCELTPYEQCQGQTLAEYLGYKTKNQRKLPHGWTSKKKMLSKRNQTQNTTYCITIYIRYPPPKIYIYIYAETGRWVVAQGRKRRSQIPSSISPWKVTEMFYRWHHGDDCTVGKK